MTVKQELHQSIDTLSDEEAKQIREMLGRSRDRRRNRRSADEIDRLYDEIIAMVDPAIPPLPDDAVDRGGLYD